jgi:hypothetical protein
LQDQQSCQRAIHEEVLESPVLVPILFLALCLCIALFTIYSSFWIAFSSLACLAIGLVLYTIFHSRFGLPRSGHYQRWAYRVNGNIQSRASQFVFFFHSHVQIRFADSLKLYSTAKSSWSVSRDNHFKNNKTFHSTSTCQIYHFVVQIFRMNHATIRM